MAKRLEAARCPNRTCEHTVKVRGNPIKATVVCPKCATVFVAELIYRGLKR